MPYEDIQGEIVTMSNEVDSGISGNSTDWTGALNRAIEVRWKYPGGISSMNLNAYGDIWGGEIGEKVDALIVQYEAGTLSVNDFRTQVNILVYNRVTQLLSNDPEELTWNHWAGTYQPCVTIHQAG